VIIKKYGIKLVRIKEKDIELIRKKRNSSDINNLMHDRKKISPEMQKIWFAGVNNIYNNYFIIYHKNKKIGLINGKNSDYTKRQSEGGMFIWDKNYWDTAIPALCSVIMSDFTFLITNFNRNYIKILKSNKKAIQHNLFLGYVPTNDLECDEETQWYVLTKENYLKRIPKLRKGAKVITKDGEPLTIHNIDFSDDNKEDFEKLYKPLPQYVRKTVLQILKLNNSNLFIHL